MLHMPQHQLLKRQHSGASASTSQPQHSQNAVTTSSTASKVHNRTDVRAHASSIPASSTTRQHSSSSSSSTEGPTAVSAFESSSHTQGPSPALSATTTDSLEDQDAAADLRAVEAAQQHQPLDDIKVLGEEPAAPPGTNPLAGSPAQPTISPLSDIPHQAQELEGATGSNLSLQILSIPKESRPMPEGSEADTNSSRLGQSEDIATDSTVCVLVGSRGDAFSGSVEGQPEGKVQKAVKAETLAFQASFAQAAAAVEADRPAVVDFAMAGQRTEMWHTMRQGRLTASAFANALGYGLIACWCLKMLDASSRALRALPAWLWVPCPRGAHGQLSLHQSTLLLTSPFVTFSTVYSWRFPAHSMFTLQNSVMFTMWQHRVTAGCSQEGAKGCGMRS